MPQNQANDGELSITQLAKRLGTTAASVSKRAKRRNMSSADFLLQLATEAGEKWEAAGTDGKAIWFKQP